MKHIYILFLLFTILQSSLSQEIGKWESHLSYYNTTKIAETNNYVFAIAKGAKINNQDTDESGGSLFSYRKDDNSIKLYSRENGLSDQQITLINYDSQTNTLLIIYQNSNIDLLKDGDIYNIPYLKNSTNITNKIIHDINFHNGFAYLCGEFGIMVINMTKQEITNTYRINNPVSSSCIKNDSLYAVTEDGIIKGNINDNLMDINNWDNYTISSLPANIQQIVLFQNYLCFMASNDGIYYQKEDNSITPLIKDGNLKQMKIQNNKLITFTDNRAYIYSSINQRDIIYNETINDISSLKDENTYWIAAGTDCIKGIQKQNEQYNIIFSDTITSQNSPKRDLCAFMTTYNEKLFVAGGDRWADRYNYNGTFMIYDNKTWINYDENKVAQQANTSYFRDATSIAIDPNPENENHYFVSTWGEGVYEFKNDKCINLYNNQNSILESANNNNNHYIRIEGLCFDKDNNLWMTNTGATNGIIKVLKKDGTWCSLGKDDDLVEASIIDKILITSNGLKWVNVPRPTSGIFILDDNETIENSSDDTYKFFVNLANINDNSEVTARAFYCMAEDKEGAIYIGTGNGVMICQPSNNILQNERLYVSRITRESEDGNLQYFLDGERVNAIAVDGGNRKWIGTENSGVFLISADASETIYNFTTENSPIFSNTIKSIAIDHTSGIVYFGTDKGIISYVSSATEGSNDYSNVYAYPNPVRPTYNKVTITGLMENSNVKITDLNGNLIYQGKSLGGRLTWNCCNRSGRRVASGVYLVLAATEDSKESVVTKIAVIK